LTEAAPGFLVWGVGIALAAMLAEAVYYLAVRRPDRLATLLAGAALAVGLLLALEGAWWGWIGLCLTLSLVGHLLDLSVFFRARPPEK
jgi:hypothetical protein